LASTKNRYFHNRGTYEKKGAELAETIDIIGAIAQPQQAIREMIRDVITSSHIFPSVRLKPEQMQKRQEKDSTSE